MGLVARDTAYANLSVLHSTVAPNASAIVARSVIEAQEGTVTLTSNDNNVLVSLVMVDDCTVNLPSTVVDGIAYEIMVTRPAEHNAQITVSCGSPLIDSGVLIYNDAAPGMFADFQVDSGSITYSPLQSDVCSHLFIHGAGGHWKLTGIVLADGL